MRSRDLPPPRPMIERTASLRQEVEAEFRRFGMVPSRAHDVGASLVVGDYEDVDPARTVVR